MATKHHTIDADGEEVVDMSATLLIKDIEMTTSREILTEPIRTRRKTIGRLMRACI